MKAEFLIERPTASGETVTSNAQKFAVYRTDDEEPLKWSGSTPLPQIGDETRVTMNNIGPATVVGFFKEEGFVGVMGLGPVTWNLLTSLYERTLNHKA